MSKPESKAEEGDKAKGLTKLDKTKQSDIKEKTYTTKQVETSITILASPENDVVLEALLFLSKYVDINRNNVLYLISKGIIPKLVKNFGKNICIVRLSLRLLSNLLNLQDAIYEIDQDLYDESLISITNMYIEHKDAHVREFCVEILSKVASSCRINILIFKVDLLNPIFENIKSSKNLNILYHTLLLFFKLVDAPAAVSSLPEAKNFDIGIIVLHINNKDVKISSLVLDIIEKLTSYGLPFIQESFKKIHLVEKMLRIIMDESRSYQHDVVIKVIHNCIKCDETNCYFIESIEFLEFCQWIKTCHPKYLLPMIEVFIELTNIPEVKQIIFDLSVEESILYFFRYEDKKVINKTCQAVSNMTTHKFCCRHMLTLTLAGIFLEILERQNDDEDPNNEVALKTIYHFIGRHFLAINIFFEKGLKSILMHYFQVKSKFISEESFLMVLEILSRCMANPTYQDEFVIPGIISELLRLFQVSSPAISTMCCEMLTNVSHLDELRNMFNQSNGPNVFIDVLNNTDNIELLTQILYFIFTGLIYKDMAMAFLHGGLIKTLNSFNEFIISKIPLTKKVLHLALNYYPPIKFYETGILEITDRLPNKFYVINGPWIGPFPFLEILEGMFVSPNQTIYLVDYSYEVRNDPIENVSQSTIRSAMVSLKSSSGSLKGSNVPSKPSKKSAKSSSSTLTSLSGYKSSSDSSISSVPSVFDINYGRISKDPFLPRYIHHIKKYEKFIKGHVEDRIRFLAEYVDTLLCGAKENLTLPQKIHEYKLHIECLKNKLGNNIIPIGYLRLGFHCERALLFKALADKIALPCSLVKGNSKLYWNEVALFEGLETDEKIKFYIVDLLDNLGCLMLVGSREANKYCNLN